MLGIASDRGGQAPALRLSRPFSLHRRAWALACHTRIRAGFPRHAPIAGDRPPRYGIQNRPCHRRARACPSPCLDREGNGIGPRAFFAQVGRSRGTGPRATVSKTAPVTVGRGPVPRHANDREGNGVSLRAFFARVGRSRGTGPRATVVEAVSPSP